MFTRKKLDNHINSFLSELVKNGYSPNKVILFGSYANGKPTDLSDIDLAIWDTQFTGCGTVDVSRIASILSNYPSIELHPFAVDETIGDNPFIEEIVTKGIEVPLTQRSN